MVYRIFLEKKKKKGEKKKKKKMKGGTCEGIISVFLEKCSVVLLFVTTERFQS